MPQNESSDFVTEPARQRPVLHDVDVAVAGSGLCGTFAAIAAGRCGARTLVIDRFGALGGNIGPGMIVNGSLDGEAEVTLPGGLSGIPREFMDRLEALRQGWTSGEFRPTDMVEPNVSLSTGRAFHRYGDGVVGLHITCRGAIDAGDPVQISRLEGRMREQAMKAVLFYRHYVPGFRRAYLLTCSAFLGMRGGSHIDGEHTLTPDEAFAGRKCADVLFRNTHEREHGGDPSGFDVPYGIVLPKEIDGLLVCGRGAAYLRRGHDPTGMRARPSMMVFGQAVGTAAAVAALDDLLPKEVDMQKVQRRLVADGIHLGDETRLRELELA